MTTPAGTATRRRCSPNTYGESTPSTCPWYLESSNPANLYRYMRLGFEPIGEIEVPDGRPAVTTMWRPPRTSAS